MKKVKSKNSLHFREVILYSILFVFFFQLIVDFIEAVYVFGLLGTSIPPEIVSVAFFFSPLILLGIRNKIPKWLFLLSGWLVLLCRVTEVALETKGRMLVSGLGVAAFLVFFPACLGTQLHDEPKDRCRKLGAGLIFALTLSMLFRALQSGFDITSMGGFQAIGWILALFAGFQLWELGRQEGASSKPERNSGSKWRVIIFSCGLAAVFLLLYFVFTSPNVIARWAEVNYLLILGLILFSLCLFGWLWFVGKLSLVKRTLIHILNLVFVFSMVLTILQYQIGFSTSPDGYPLLEPELPALSIVLLIFMLVTFPVNILNFILYSLGMMEERPTPRTLGLGFFVASLFTLIMILAHVFTTVNDYIPVIGPFFRDKFWLVHLVVGIVAAAPVLSVREERFPKELFSQAHKHSAVLRAVLIGVAVASVSAVLLLSAKPSPPTAVPTELRVLTYNIQQGYSEDGAKNYKGQLELIQSMAPDILGLQESDTNRIAGGNSDIVRYFADQLDMYSYYGPSPVTGTFGIALLSRFPIEEAKTFYMYSEGEQTALIEARIEIGEIDYAIFVTHLGNGGPIIQQEQFLEVLEGKKNIIAMGDFNFRPETEQYQLSIDVLEDAFIVSQKKWDAGEFDLSQRIDHIFVSPEITVEEAEYILSSHSDHPAMFAVVSLTAE